MGGKSGGYTTIMKNIYLAHAIDVAQPDNEILKLVLDTLVGINGTVVFLPSCGFKLGNCMEVNKRSSEYIHKVNKQAIIYCDVIVAVVDYCFSVGTFADLQIAYDNGIPIILIDLSVNATLTKKSTYLKVMANYIIGNKNIKQGIPILLNILKGERDDKQ